MAEDIRAAEKAPVYAPVDGKIVYYHTKNVSGVSDPEQTFIVLRDNYGRDYVLGHVNCSVCKAAGVGDSGAYSAVQEVKKGETIGSILPNVASSPHYTHHLHFGLNSGEIVDAKGVLKTDYQHGQWADLHYIEGNAADLARAEKTAKDKGWIDPLDPQTAAWAYK